MTTMPTGLMETVAGNMTFFAPLWKHWMNTEKRVNKCMEHQFQQWKPSTATSNTTVYDGYMPQSWTNKYLTASSRQWARRKKCYRCVKEIDKSNAVSKIICIASTGWLIDLTVRVYVRNLGWKSMPIFSSENHTMTQIWQVIINQQRQTMLGNRQANCLYEWTSQCFQV